GRTPLGDSIRDQLARRGDPVRAKGAQAYMKSEMPFRGVDARGQREIHRACLKQHPVRSIDELRNATLDLWDRAEYREERYAAQEILKKYSKFLDISDRTLLRHIIITGAWWDYVDFVAKWVVGDLLKRYPEEMKQELMEWIEDEDLWIRRAAILAQLSFKDKTDTQLLFNFCDRCLEETTFWMRKAIGWALREYSKTNPGKVRQFIAKNRDRMAGLTLREASKYV
ncbi:MAG: DNA alkylation repair protein, partial [bacterium]